MSRLIWCSTAGFLEPFEAEEEIKRLQGIEKRQSAENLRLLDALKEAAKNPGGDYYTGLNCGVEDRALYAYEAAAYGWDSAFDYVQSIIDPVIGLQDSVSTEPAPVSPKTAIEKDNQKRDGDRQ